ncbi:unnamed protein product [Rangifer tarandus platyrhynchus]|uniref:Uncharacterized protein n=1 Tax=Rangifer tarandus platyrhynchus TaxID=3082113 RepID=A0ABN8ZEK4_RANTA|nr:unnamed protein product [Rangifer tarandus platyrhynchus]
MPALEELSGAKSITVIDIAVEPPPPARAPPRPAAQLYPSWKPSRSGDTRAERTAAEEAAAAQLPRAEAGEAAPARRSANRGGCPRRERQEEEPGRTLGGAGALPGKVKLEPEAARGRGGPEQRGPVPRRAEP